MIKIALESVEFLRRKFTFVLSILKASATLELSLFSIIDTLLLGTFPAIGAPTASSTSYFELTLLFNSL